MPRRQEASSAPFFRVELCRILCKGSLWGPSPPPASPIPPFLGVGGGWGGGGCPHHPRPDPAPPSFFGAMQQNAKSLWPTGGQFARVVKGVDLRSTAGNCAWVRTPQLASLSAVGFCGHGNQTNRTTPAPVRPPESEVGCRTTFHSAKEWRVGPSNVFILVCLSGVRVGIVVVVWLGFPVACLRLSCAL